MKTFSKMILSLIAMTLVATSASAASRGYDLPILHCDNVRSLPETLPNPDGVPTEYIDIQNILVLEAEDVAGEKTEGAALAIVQIKETLPRDGYTEDSHPDALAILGTFTYVGTVGFVGETGLYKLSISYARQNSSVRLEYKDEVGGAFVDSIRTDAASCNYIQYESIGVHN